MSQPNDQSANLQQTQEIQYPSHTKVGIEHVDLNWDNFINSSMINQNRDLRQVSLIQTN